MSYCPVCIPQGKQCMPPFNPPVKSSEEDHQFLNEPYYEINFDTEENWEATKTITETPKWPKSFRKRSLESIKAATTPRSSTLLLGKINGEGQMLTFEDQNVYLNHMSMTKPHKEEV